MNLENKQQKISTLYPLIPVSLFLLFWEFFAKIGVINQALLSCPSQILSEMWNLLIAKKIGDCPILLLHIYSSLYRLVIAFSVSTILAVSLGILMGTNKYIYRFFDPIITLLMPIPGIAWAPILMLWLGFGDPTIITVGAIAAFFPIVHNTCYGVRSIEKEIVWSAELLGVNKPTLLFKVCLPWATPYLLTGFKLGLARGWRTLIAVEMIAASLWGLGFMIFDARDYLRPSIIYGGIIILALIYLLLEKGLLRWIEKKTIEKWGILHEKT